MKLTGEQLLTQALLLRQQLRREVLAEGQRHVGVVLPTSVWSVVVNAALALDRRVAVNLNYTLSSELINTCIARCGIRQVVTSRRVMERFNLKIQAEVIFLEDLTEHYSPSDQQLAQEQARSWPLERLEHDLGLSEVDPDEPLTVIFTSGSTGDPSGVVLSHRNVACNVDSTFEELLRVDEHDVIVGVLPFFHSFGYTTALWSVLLTEAQGAYHYSPLDHRQVGALCRESRGTIMFSTATFLRTYMRRCEKDDFATLEILITGAEKLPMDLAEAFETQFGVRPYEGYGTTELSPVVAFNVHPKRLLPGQPKRDKFGTIGLPIPGVSVKVVDLDTGAKLEPGQMGMLLVSGHGVMQGYLHQPEKTAAVLRDGWYATGDLAMLDEEGFIQITGRQSRFSKIGGEMVPHLRIEELLMNLLGIAGEELRLAVTSVPDARKGERIVVLHTGLPQTPEQICHGLAAAGVPAIWIPTADSFCQIEAIPVLASGKLDLRRLKTTAEGLFRLRK